MRPSPLRHPLARARITAGLTQEQLAKLVGCSRETIQSVELKRNRLKLSESLAKRIEHYTGVAHEYLLHGLPRMKPMVAGSYRVMRPGSRKLVRLSWRGGEFTLETYRRHRVRMGAMRAAGYESTPETIRCSDLALHFYNIETVAKSAAAKYQLNLFVHQLESAVRELKQKFGWPDSDPPLPADYKHRVVGEPGFNLPEFWDKDRVVLTQAGEPGFKSPLIPAGS